MRQFSGLILSWSSKAQAIERVYFECQLIDDEILSFGITVTANFLIQIRDVCGYSHLGRNLQSIAVVLINLYSLYIWWFSPTSTVLPRSSDDDDDSITRFPFQITFISKAISRRQKSAFLTSLELQTCCCWAGRLRRLLAVICVGDQSTQYIYFVVQLQAPNGNLCAFLQNTTDKSAIVSADLRSESEFDMMMTCNLRHLRSSPPHLSLSLI